MDDEQRQFGDPLPRSAGSAIGRLLIGGFAGWVVANLGLRFLGFCVIGAETTILQERMLERSRYWDVEFATISAITSVFVGGYRVSTFWLWFVVAFGAICLVPIVPSKGGALLPFGTPYVNDGPLVEKIFFLWINVSIAAVVARIVHLWKTSGRHDRIVGGSTTADALPD